jgi:hypothetical protein
MAPSITELAERVAGLPTGTQDIFNRIFSLDVVKGRLKLPPSMVTWAERQFGQADSVTTQTIVKITNLVSGESSVYNPLRILRPHDFSTGASVRGVTDEGDIFAHPLESTAEDVFGRVEGRYCVTGANIAKCEQYHCVVIFKNADPMDFGCKEVADYIDTGWRWAQKAHDFDPPARYCLFIWNCTNRAGASIRHGHAQVVLARGSHYARVEQLRRAALKYRAKYGSSYFDDLFEIHLALGLGWQSGDTRTLAYLTAVKQNEVMVLAPAVNDQLTGEIYGVLAGFRDRMNVKSFNIGIVFPPMGDKAGWEQFPVIARMVDRGDTASTSSDFSAMEFYGANVVQSDPWETAGELTRRSDIVE